VYEWISKLVKLLARCECIYVFFFAIKPSNWDKFHLVSLILPLASLFLYSFLLSNRQFRV
jgi:hypothetical protein